MRTTLNLDEDMLRKAAKATGVEEKTKLIHMGLQFLICEAARQRLAKLYGAIKTARSPRRRKIP